MNLFYLNFLIKLFQTLLPREGQCLLAQLWQDNRALDVSWWLHLGTALVHSLEMQLMSPRMTNIQWLLLYCVSASLHLDHRNGHTIEKISSTHIKDIQMEILQKSTTGQNAENNYSGTASPKTSLMQPTPKAQETLEKRALKTARAREPGRTSTMRQCLLYTSGCYTHKVLTMWSL